MKEHAAGAQPQRVVAIRRAGGVGRAVESGLLTTGILHACHTFGVPYVLAGSIRDDGPLPETLMDLVAAQDAYAAALDGALGRHTSIALEIKLLTFTTT